MLNKLLILFSIFVTLIGCRSSFSSTEAELQSEINELTKRYAEFKDIGDYVENSVAIYGCTFTSDNNGNLSNIAIKKLYDSLEGKYDRQVAISMNTLSGLAFVPTENRTVKLTGKIYCFQKEKWPGTDMNVPTSLLIYDGAIHQGKMNCTREQFLEWLKLLYD